MRSKARVGLVVCFTALLVLAFVCVRYLPTKYASMSGLIIDDATGRPVGSAKVIVTLWSYGFGDSVPRHFGAVSDSEGRFIVEAKAPFFIRKINIEAATPSDKYGIVTVKREGNYEIKVKNLAEWQKTCGLYRYERFSGMWSRGGQVRFESPP